MLFIKFLFLNVCAFVNSNVFLDLVDSLKLGSSLWLFVWRFLDFLVAFMMKTRYKNIDGMITL